MPSTTSPDDRTLASRFAAGEASAFDELVATEHRRVRRLVRRLLGWCDTADVEDVVQEVFVAAFEQLSHFRGGSSLNTWLTTVALNRCRTQRRRRDSRWRVLWRWWERRNAEHVEGSDASTQRDDTSAAVRIAVNQLSPIDREVIVLHYLEHLGVDEMATLLSIRPNAVEVRLHRARARLKEKLKAMGIDGE